MGKIASGGELSRFILALKVALAEAGRAATVIFDEIDQGVGGAAGRRHQRTAGAAGNWRTVAGGDTHSPQVAARWGSNRDRQEQRGHHPHLSQPAGCGQTAEEIARMLEAPK